MADHVANRAILVDQLRRELVGPDPRGRELPAPPVFTSQEESRGPWVRPGSGEEILQRDRPCKRYGVAVLYPFGSLQEEPIDAGSETVEGESNEGASAPLVTDLERIEDRKRQERGGIDDDIDLSSANDFKPSSMGLSFLADVRDGDIVRVEFRSARYEQIEVIVPDKEKRPTPRQWWGRVPVSGTVEFYAKDVLVARRSRVQPVAAPAFPGAGTLKPEVQLLSRPRGSGNQRLITVCVINRTVPESRSPDPACLFQVELRVRIVRHGATVSSILPYPVSPSTFSRREEAETALLYRHVRTFAVGHGAACDWETQDPASASEVRTTALPAVELPHITPDVRRPDGSLLLVPMLDLAQGNTSGRRAIAEIADSYEAWIKDRRLEAAQVAEPELQEAAEGLLATCDEALTRMRRGIEMASRDPVVGHAFRLANEAMLIQQLRTSERAPRKWQLDNGRMTISPRYETYTEPPIVPPGRGNWRPFQIAFLLAAITSMADRESEDRELVELIWFPTGGGKTEAYLGLAAFAILLRRLRANSRVHAGDSSDAEDVGTEVMMRYTLRLLTSQQFQRASALVCALEYLRRREQDLGQTPFTIGLWTGGTPNTAKDARAALKDLRSGDEPDRNIVVLERCPWCRALMGRSDQRQGKGRKSFFSVYGYIEMGGTVVAHCPDTECLFHKKLPVEFIDEDMYSSAAGAPSMVIGTVDKFAMLAWQPDARVFFGRSASGDQRVSPPGLILQDELHLISGPLGSMVGLYEPVIEELCTDRRRGREVKPKIVTSTATTRAYREQARDVFGRTRVALFPPPAIRAGESFFASEARAGSGAAEPGRVYVGVYAPGLGSQQTAQVRVFSALLQAAGELPTGEERDPWWTLLMFYNSIRELGGALTLFYSDIPDQLDNIVRRRNLPWTQKRKLLRVEELTGRLHDQEVTAAISKLEIEARDLHSKAADLPVDACLASNIIEVGVDIDRLSLMVVVGQPKTTAQYIQVTGRVGRRKGRPGLVVTVYGASKPRDRSHFEKFRSYHEKLYAQVEPASVTPFSRQALERGLHAALAAYVRQAGGQRAADYPYPPDTALISRVRELLEQRAIVLQDADSKSLDRIFRHRLAEIEAFQSPSWNTRSTDAAPALLRYAGVYAEPVVAQHSWATPTSMRNVDAECKVAISLVYRDAGEEDGATGRQSDG